MCYLNIQDTSVLVYGKKQINNSKDSINVLQFTIIKLTQYNCAYYHKIIYLRNNLNPTI